ncbi:MAG: thiol-disulfide isomerase/thioredoxin [Bacteriovoracaceae bacterium]
MKNHRQKQRDLVNRKEKLDIDMRLMVITTLLLLSFVVQASLIDGIDLRTDKLVQLKISKKKPTVLYFLSAWCPCSQGTFDHLNELQAKYKEIDFVGFHSSVEIPKKDALEYFGKFKIDFPIIQDDKVIYADKYKAVKTPHVFIYGTKGELLFQGGATNSRTVKRAKKFYLRDALEAISMGKEPKIKNAKTIGCYIQR